jgi:hypothetical protein
MTDYSYLLELALADANEGWTLVFFAVQGTRVNIVDFCLAKGGDANITSPHGVPLLAFAILTSNSESGLNIVKTILRHGADADYVLQERPSPSPSALAAWAQSADRASCGCCV